MGKLMKIREDAKVLIKFNKNTQKEDDIFKFETNYRDGFATLVLKTGGLSIEDEKDREAWSELMTLCTYIEFGVAADEGGEWVRVDFEIADAFIHIPDEKKE